HRRAGEAYAAPLLRSAAVFLPCNARRFHTAAPRAPTHDEDHCPRQRDAARPLRHSAAQRFDPAKMRIRHHCALGDSTKGGTVLSITPLTIRSIALLVRPQPTANELAAARRS